VYREVVIQLHTCLNSALDRDEWSAAYLCPVERRALVPTDQEAEWDHSQSGSSLPLLGIKSQLRSPTV